MYAKIMKSFTVRLHEKDAEAIRSLRREGINVADLFRSAVHEKHTAIRRTKRWTKDSLARLFAELDEIVAEAPLADWIARGIDVTDRRQMRAYIRERLLRNKAQK